MFERLNRISIRTIIILLVLGGIAERALFAVLRPFPGAAGEGFDIAQALVNGAGFSDAYWTGQGPTAHLLPINPLIAAGVYSIFGLRSWTSELLLGCWSVGLALSAYLILFRAFGRLGTPVWARLGALGFGFLVPIYITEEVVDFRIWEGGLAVFLCAAFLDRLIAIVQSSVRLSIASVAGMALLTALLFFVNPLLGLGAYACAGLVCVTKLHGRQLIGAMSVAALALAMFVGPWAIRNKLTLGEFILLRTNAGLELALANYQGAIDATDRNREYLRRVSEIHPRASKEAREKLLVAGGEIQYSRQLGEETRRWIVANPGATLMLALRHLRQMLSPDPWQFQLWRSGTYAVPRAVLAGSVGALGLLGLALALVRRRQNWIFPALLVVIPTVAFCLFQPIPRYNYLFYPLLVFCAADAFSFFASRSVAVSRHILGAKAAADGILRPACEDRPSPSLARLPTAEVLDPGARQSSPKAMS